MLSLFEPDLARAQCIDGLLALCDVLYESLVIERLAAWTADSALRHDAPKKHSVLAFELTGTAASFSFLFHDSDKGVALSRVEPYLAAPIVEAGNCLPR